MSKLNLLVIDDETVEVKRQINELREIDTNNILGEVRYFSEFPKDIETLDLSSYIDIKESEKIDAILIDYDLGSQYSGTLLSAWLALRNRFIPRIAFTTRKYQGQKTDFDGYIMKNDIIDDPEKVLMDIVKIVDDSNIEGWLDKKYMELINQYSHLCEKRLKTKLSHEEESTLKLLKDVLDNMDKQMDIHLEKTIEMKFKMANKENEKLEFLKQSISDLDNEINDILSKLETDRDVK